MNYLMKVCTFLTFCMTISSCAQGKKPLPIHEVTAFIHVNVITMSDPEPLMDQTIIVKDEVITTIGPSSTIKIPENACIIDGENQKYITPGLVDTHVHINRSKSKEWATYFVANGVTTVFNLKGNKKVLSLRESVRKKQLLAPDIYTSGPFIGMRSKNLHKLTKKGIEKEVLSQKKAGYDMMKIHGDMTLEVYQHLMDFSRKHDMHVMGHIPRNLTFQNAIDVRQLSLAHAEEMIYTQFVKLDTTTIAPYAQQAGAMGMWLAPTMTAFNTLSKSWGDPTVIDAVMELPETKELHPYIQKVYKQDWYGDRDITARDFFQKANTFHKPLVTGMYNAGVKLLLGTDTPMPAVPPGVSLHDEIDLMLAIGMTPYETLKMGTYNAGLYIVTHIDDQAKFGQVKEGYRANLLLLSSNPLDNMTILRTPEGVMHGGSWYDDNALKDMITW
ncbi:Amidohydrolase family protein [Dokdonia pacifica]|uniref:Amidohydrolase family protein n=2 Tax=Dokdonia pacifica TaxID=1627892 RepID=A0A238VZW3_9FLAO|nr:Amidohydrolase family protein [Dokdonia pacifica]